MKTFYKVKKDIFNDIVKMSLFRGVRFCLTLGFERPEENSGLGEKEVYCECVFCRSEIFWAMSAPARIFKKFIGRFPEIPDTKTRLILVVELGELSRDYLTQEDNVVHVYRIIPSHTDIFVEEI